MLIMLVLCAQITKSFWKVWQELKCTMATKIHLNVVSRHSSVHKSTLCVCTDVGQESNSKTCTVEQVKSVEKLFVVRPYAWTTVDILEDK